MEMNVAFDPIDVGPLRMKGVMVQASGRGGPDQATWAFDLDFPWLEVRLAS